MRHDWMDRRKERGMIRDMIMLPGRRVKTIELQNKGD